MKIVVLVPYRPDGGHRDRLWNFCRAWWLERHPDWPIYTDPGPDGLFNRSAAVNGAAAQAGDWDLAIILDADVIVNPEAVHAAIDKATTSGCLVLPHDERLDLNRDGTERVLSGYRGSWRPFTHSDWSESVSCCVMVPRPLWDAVGGFDERFRGWGFEDSAFVAACETASGPLIKLHSEVFHLWHERPDDGAASRQANQALLAEYRSKPKMIPRIFHRTVPEAVDPQVEQWWEQRQKLHPGWEFRTYRDPIDPKLFPLTSKLWPKCQNGAQLAGLIRLEALVTWGGVYVDSDCRPVGSHEPLRCAQAYAAWEDSTTVPDAVMACVPGHPAFVAMLDEAKRRVTAGRNAYESGPMVSTKFLPGRNDVLLLPPGAMFPVHYLEKSALGTRDAPWVIEEHQWHHSWGDEQSKASIAARQR